MIFIGKLYFLVVRDNVLMISFIHILWKLVSLRNFTSKCYGKTKLKQSIPSQFLFSFFLPLPFFYFYLSPFIPPLLRIYFKTQSSAGVKLGVELLRPVTTYESDQPMWKRNGTMSPCLDIRDNMGNITFIFRYRANGRSDVVMANAVSRRISGAEAFII